MNWHENPTFSDNAKLSHIGGQKISSEADVKKMTLDFTARGIGGEDSLAIILSCPFESLFNSTVLAERDYRGYNQVHLMSQKRRTLRLDSIFISLLLRRCHQKAFLLLVLLAVPDWSVATGSPSTLTADQERGVATQQAQSGTAKTGEQSLAPAPSDSTSRLKGDLALVQSIVGAVHVPDSRALAEALRINVGGTKEAFTDLSSNFLEDLDDLDGDGVREFAFKQMRSAKKGAPNVTGLDELPSWELFLLAWDGAGWRASWLRSGFEPFELHVVSSNIPGSREIALVIYTGASETPYPAIYQMKDHAAALVWDGRADESEYQGYARGKIEFRNLQAGGAPQMIVSGRADPGLLHFPKDSKRGFDVQAIYVWAGTSYVPNKTEYSANEDYTLYQFISALHLHDFRSAYALIDAPKFLKTDMPSPEIFRKRIEGSWPEFLDDQIFEVPNPSSSGTNGFEFELTEEDKHYVYLPSFGTDSKHLLAGLERHEESGADR
jgi:hypothetical protein